MQAEISDVEWGQMLKANADWVEAVRPNPSAVRWVSCSSLHVIIIFIRTQDAANR